MAKQRITWIWQKDLDSYFEAAEKAKKDGDDYVVVPDGLEIYKVPTKLERIQAEIDELEKWFESNKESTKEELVETGKVHDEYFQKKELLEHYKKQLEK